jgi:hypothetical protein
VPEEDAMMVVANDFMIAAWMVEFEEQVPLLEMDEG